MSEPLDHAAFPPVPPSLVKRLDELFPDRCPNLSEPDRMVWYSAGQASVVSFLKSILKDQQE